MESLSRPLNRKKLPNANNFSGENAYDGVLSGHRRKYDGAPAIKIEEYHEIFNSGQADSSIPVLDLSTLEESVDGLSLEMWSTKPDYGMIFGGFRDHGIAICYEEMVARDKARARARSSASQSSQDLGGLSDQPSDALRQFNMAYNKISQRSKDGLDGSTTHVTRLPDVSGFTCFMNESASKTKKETENRKSFVANNIHPGVNSSKGDSHEKQTSQSAVEFRSRRQDELLSGHRISNTSEVDLKPHPSKVSSPPDASQPNKETENQKSYLTNNVHPSMDSNKRDFPKKQKSQGTFEFHSRPEDESLSSDRIFKTVEVDLKPHPFKISSPPAISQSNKETENQKSFIANNVPPQMNSSKGDFPEKQTSQSPVEFRSRHQDESVSDDKTFKTFAVDVKQHSSKVLSPPAASQSNKETENQKSYITDKIHLRVNSSKGDHEKQTSQSAADSRSIYGQDASISGDRNFMKFEAELKPHPSKVSSPLAASQSNKETENQESYITNNINPSVNSSKGDFHETQTSQNAAKSRSIYGQDASISDDRNFKKFQADLRSHPTKVSSSPAGSATNFDDHKDYQKISTAKYRESHSTCFNQEFDVDSAAAVSAAALRQAIEKAQENIRIAKESVGRKKGTGGFSSKSFKDSLKVKAKVANVKAGVDYEEKDRRHESTVVFPDFMDGEKLFGAKKVVINEPHGKIPEVGMNSEILIRSPVELREDEILSASKSIINNACEGPLKDFEKPNDFPVFEICEKKLGDTDSNKLTMHQKVEDEKELHRKFDENDFEKKFSEDSFGLFETSKEENLEQEYDEKVGSAASQVEDEREVKDEEEEKLYDVCEVEVLKNAETYDCSTETNDLSQKEDYEIKEKENDETENTWEKLNSSSDDDANKSRSVIGATQTVDDIEESCKVDQNDDNAESSQVINDVSRSSSSGHEFHVEDTETIEKETIGNVSSNETEDKKDECDSKSDDLGNRDFEQNDYSIETDDLSQKEDYEIKERENYSAKETWKKFDKIQVPEESESVIGASLTVDDDTEEACKVDQNDNNAESSQEIDDVSRSSGSGVEFQVEDTEAIAKETRENVSSNETEDNKDECDSKKLDKIQDYDDAEESESVIGARQLVDDTEEACKVDQNNNAEPIQEIDDVSSSSSSSCHDFQEEDTGALEKVIIVNLSSDETEDNEDECDTNSDNLANCGLADVDFVQNAMRSESSSDTIVGTQMEVTVEKEDNNLQQSHEETPEISIKIEAGPQQEPEDASRESEPSKTVEKTHNEEETERERIRLAVERAIREARERAYAEVRQRVIADTQETVTKPSSDKTCAQSKLKAERAAVERATAEARQRALEKAVSQKKMSEPKIKVNETNQTTSATNHTNAESALRCKAKLEKHNRIMERAAKALAEKEMRDLLALREQAERNRLAENLDADIKRWSSGKEGNLRALLSTLQYILGADSGWQPVSLTEIITTSAVKKAYRKATLCVHPDKLQQRGASIQQKYICEKVFDLLKAAWNRFNSEER